jgi:type IV secretory pathway TraG/TraD family ATPase VirD4
MVVSYGEDEARSIFGLTNNLVIFGGGKDIHFYRELSELIDDVRTSRQTVTDGPGGIGTSRAGEWERVLRPGDIRRIPQRQALVIAGNAPPIIAKLRRCIDGSDGQTLRAEQVALREQVMAARQAKPDLDRRTAAAVAYSRANLLTPDTDRTGGEGSTAAASSGAGEWPWG